MIGNYTFPRACWRCMSKEPTKEECAACRDKNTETVHIVASSSDGSKKIVEFGASLLRVSSKMIKNIRKEISAE